jgi:polysaccharide export outer membrane protein
MKRVAAVLCVAAGCATSGPYVWVDDLPDQAFEHTPYRIHTDDRLNVLVWNQESISGEVRVRPDGKVTLPLVGDIAVAGLTPPACAAQITRRLDGLILDPKVTVTVSQTKTPTVSVVGEVRDVGEYPVRQEDTVLQILARAGGLTEFSRPDHVYVLRRGAKSVRIRFTYEQLIEGTGRALSFKLRDGDIVIVR